MFIKVFFQLTFCFNNVLKFAAVTLDHVNYVFSITGEMRCYTIVSVSPVVVKVQYITVSS